MVEDDEKPVVAPPSPGLSPVKMVLGLVVLIGLNYVFTDLLDESVRLSSPLLPLVHTRPELSRVPSRGRGFPCSW